MGGVTAMEMQMMTGARVPVTHWASMMPYDPNTFTPPLPRVVPSTAARTPPHTQRGRQRIVAGRLAVMADGVTGDAAEAWLHPFGARNGQNTQAGSSGFNASGGGFIAGLDREAAPDGRPGSLDVELRPRALWQLRGPAEPFRRCADRRRLQRQRRKPAGAVGANASADYDSHTFHAGAGLRLGYDFRSSLSGFLNQMRSLDLPMRL